MCGGAAWDQPAGPLLLWSSFAACVALAIWQTSDAIFDFEHCRRRRTGEKAKAALQAVVYAGLALTLFSFASGAGKDHTSSTSDLTASLLKAREATHSCSPSARGSQSPESCTPSAASAVLRRAPPPSRLAKRHGWRWPSSASVGYAAKGIVLLLVGLLVIVATIKAHPEESTGLDGGLRALLTSLSACTSWLPSAWD